MKAQETRSVPGLEKNLPSMSELLDMFELESTALPGWYGEPAGPEYLPYKETDTVEVWYNLYVSGNSPVAVAPPAPFGAMLPDFRGPSADPQAPSRLSLGFRCDLSTWPPKISTMWLRGATAIVSDGPLYVATGVLNQGCISPAVGLTGYAKLGYYFRSGLFTVDFFAQCQTPCAPGSPATEYAMLGTVAISVCAGVNLGTAPYTTVQTNAIHTGGYVSFEGYVRLSDFSLPSPLVPMGKILTPFDATIQTAAQAAASANLSAEYGVQISTLTSSNGNGKFSPPSPGTFAPFSHQIPSKQPLTRLSFWVNAFIPRTLQGTQTYHVLAGPYKGDTGIAFSPVPILVGDPTGELFLTDQGYSSNYWGSSSRVRVRLDLEVLGGLPSLFVSKGIGATHQIERVSGNPICIETAPLDTLKVSDPYFFEYPTSKKIDTSVVCVDIDLSASNPCAPGSSLAPISIEGRVVFDLANRAVSFEGKLTRFPVIEMYATVNNSIPKRLLLSMPAKGATPYALGAPKKAEYGVVQDANGDGVWDG